MPRSPEQIEQLRNRVAEIESWYHAIDLGDGIRTPGAFDMGTFLPRYALPESMAGMRVLDVGASNGFFSFEFERRGAAEVVALDLSEWLAHDWTPRHREQLLAKGSDHRAAIDRHVLQAGFALVAEALGSQRVRKHESRIYDIGPETLGEFDLVFCGSMLMHVRDPILGIQKMRSVCKPGGRVVVSISTCFTDVDEPIARFAGKWDECNWWQMNPRCLETVLECCDFDRIENRERFVLEDVSGQFADETFVCHALPRTTD